MRSDPTAKESRAKRWKHGSAYLILALCGRAAASEGRAAAADHEHRRAAARGTQHELMDALVRAGCRVTQATISRDIRELGLEKTHDVLGRPRYVAAADRERRIDPREIARGAAVAVRPAGRRRPEHRRRPVRARLGARGRSSARPARASAIVGTLAGDDTCVAIARNSRDATALARELAISSARRLPGMGLFARAPAAMSAQEHTLAGGRAESAGSCGRQAGRSESNGTTRLPAGRELTFRVNGDRELAARRTLPRSIRAFEHPTDRHRRWRRWLHDIDVVPERTTCAHALTSRTCRRLDARSIRRRDARLLGISSDRNGPGYSVGRQLLRVREGPRRDHRRRQSQPGSTSRGRAADREHR